MASTESWLGLQVACGESSRTGEVKKDEIGRTRAFVPHNSCGRAKNLRFPARKMRLVSFRQTSRLRREQSNRGAVEQGRRRRTKSDERRRSPGLRPESGDEKVESRRNETKARDRGRANDSPILNSSSDADKPAAPGRRSQKPPKSRWKMELCFPLRLREQGEGSLRVFRPLVCCPSLQTYTQSTQSRRKSHSVDCVNSVYASRT